MGAALKFDARGAERKTLAALRASPAARQLAIGQLAVESVRIIARVGPRDTRRYVRGYIVAANGIAAATGASPTPVPAVRASAFASSQHDRLEADYLRWVGIRRKWVAIIRGMEQFEGHQKWKSYRDALKTLDKVGDAEDRAFLALQAYRAQKDGSIVVWGRSASTGLTPGAQRRLINSATDAGGATSAARVRRNIRLSSIATVHPTPYGGVGRVFDAGETTFAEVRNLEPHASIVERRVGAARRALSQLRAAGLARSVPRAYKLRMGAAFRVGDASAALEHETDTGDGA